MGILGSFVGLLVSSAVYVGADIKETCDRVDLQRKLDMQKPAPPPGMRDRLHKKYINEWHRGDDTNFPEYLHPALKSDSEVFNWYIQLLAEKEIKRQGYRGFPVSIEGNFNRVYNEWKERQGWVR